jgi:hypothetical protein
MALDELEYSTRPKAIPLVLASQQILKSISATGSVKTEDRVRNYVEG